MSEFTLTYARVVVLKTSIEAESEEEAWNIASDLEFGGKLGLKDWEPKEGSWTSHVTDYEEIWELEEDSSGDDEEEE